MSHESIDLTNLGELTLWDTQVTDAGLVHLKESVAYRWVGESGDVGYTGDTGPHPPLEDFFEGVRLLIAECSHGDPPAVATHLTPGGVARLAGAVTPELVVTTHVYPPLSAEAVPELISKAGYDGWVIAGRDGMRLSLEDGAILSR